MNTMPAWRAWMLRIDALALRERVLMFLSATVVLLALADYLVLSPRLAEQKALAKRLRAQATEMATLRAQLQDTGSNADTPALRLQRELQAVRADLQQAEQELARRGGGSTGLAQLTESAIARHPQLVLLKLATVAPEPGRDTALAADTVELSVAGSYTEITRYVQELERTQPGLRWLELRLRRTDAATELHARLALPGAVR